MSAVTSPYGPTEMLSDSVYNYATSRRSAAAEQGSDGQYEAQAKLQISSIQKPRNKRKNFKPISSRMAEVSDESENDEDDAEVIEDAKSSNDVLEYQRKTMMLLPNDERSKRLNNNEASPMDLSVATRPASSDNDDDSNDSLRHRIIFHQLTTRNKLYSPGTEARSPNSDSSSKSESCLDQDGRLEDQDATFDDERHRQDEADEVEEAEDAEADDGETMEGEGDGDGDCEGEIEGDLEEGEGDGEGEGDAEDGDLEGDGECEVEDGDADREMRARRRRRRRRRTTTTTTTTTTTMMMGRKRKTYEGDGMREYAESTIQELMAIYGLSGELAKSVSRQLPPTFLNPTTGQERLRLKDDKESSAMAPGSPPTPPHTPQSPPRQNPPANLSQSCQTPNASSPGLGLQQLHQQQQQQLHQQQQQHHHHHHQQQQQQHHQEQHSHLHSMADNSVLGQLLVLYPAVAQLVHQDPTILSRNRLIFEKSSNEEPDDSRVRPTIASLAALKVEAADPKVSALLRQSMSPVAETLIGGTKSSSAPSSPIIDYSRYVRRYTSGLECGSSYCKELGCREHFHCLDCSGRVFVKKEEMIRHFKWHKKRDESLQHGFMRYSPTDDCSERHPGRACPHNRKQTHYHCIHENCDKVYISTSDVQMHANYHRKDSAIIQEGFQRFRASESCATEHCPFVSQRTTHFHCRRPGCRFTFKNKADMDKHKSYHIKDEQLSRDGFKKFMKSEACPFEQCRFSRVCNHIHCIRPHCSYVLHSSGQLFSHKRKHERHESEVAYRKYKQVSGGGAGAGPGGAGASALQPSPVGAGIRPSGTWAPDEIGAQGCLGLSFNGESSNEDRGSPSYYSLDDSFQSASDLAMDLTAPSNALTTVATGGGGGGSSSSTATTPLEQALQQQQQQQQQLTTAELAYLVPAGTECPCHLGRDHHHCALDRCGATLKDPREVREHLREHETQERITDTFFEEGGCDDTCPYTDKEKHYHCNWENCREVILSTDKPFRRLQHYKIHEYSRQLNLSCSTHELSSDVTLTHLTNIDAMFRRKRGRPPKNRVIEIWSGGDPATHTQDSPQAIFTSFKLPKPQTPSSTPIPSNDDRDGSLSPTNSLGEPEGFSTYNPDNCLDLSCALRHAKHHHCTQARCHFSTDRPDQLLMHSKDFHDNVDILPGFAFFDKMIDCLLPTCHSNRVNRHFHCTRPNCSYSFVRYSTMSLHEKQHVESTNAQDTNTPECQRQSLQIIQETIAGTGTKPRIQVKNPAELIEKPEENLDENNSTIDDKDSGVPSPDVSKTTVVRAAGTYYPVSGPPSEPALPGVMLSMRASVHQESPVLPSTSSTSSHTLYGPEQSCGRPFCKLKRKNHYHCNACNQAFSELDRLVAHIAKHSTGAILSQQQQHEIPSQPTANQLQHDYLAQLSQKHDFMAQNAQMAQNIQNFQNQMQRQMQQTLGQMSQPVVQAKDVKMETARCGPDMSVQNISCVKREPKREPLDGSRDESLINSMMDGSNENGQHSQVTVAPAPTAQQSQPPTSFELDLSHGFHFPSPAMMAAMNQQFALMNQALPPFLQHSGMYTGGSGLMFAHGLPGLPPANFLPQARDENPLASLAANLNLGKRSLSPPDSNSVEAKKQRLHHSMRMLKDEPVPEGYVRFRFNEDCRYPHCGYREHQTHFHCMRQDCGYSFCDKTRFVQHTARHERLDTLMGGDFQQYRANVPCGRAQCAYTSSLGSMQNKASHFHCLKCDFVCTDTNKVVAHRRQHAKLDSIAAAGFQKFTPSQPCGAVQCQHSGKQTHYHCLQCQYAVLGLAQMSAHKYRHMDT